MNDLTPTRSEMPSAGYSAQAELTIELAKMLALVAPSSMTSEQQEIWLRAAVEGLEGIRASEVRDVAAEVKRSVTRHNQLVPEISKLVAEHRKRVPLNDEGRCRCGKGTGPFAGRTDIHWVKVDGRSQIEFCGEV